MTEKTPRLEVTALDIAQRFIGMAEVPGSQDNPQILSMLRLDQAWPKNDEVPWCSAFLNYVTWLLRLPRSKSLAARSWLTCGRPVSLEYARPGFDVVILARGPKPWPGSEIIDAPGHVGLFLQSEHDIAGRKIYIVAGNESNKVGVSWHWSDKVLGIRRLLG